MNTLRQVRAFFISSAFTDNTRLILAKNQEKAKQHPEADYSEYNEYKISQHENAHMYQATTKQHLKFNS